MTFVGNSLPLRPMVLCLWFDGAALPVDGGPIVIHHPMVPRRLRATRTACGRDSETLWTSCWAGALTLSFPMR